MEDTQQNTIKQRVTTKDTDTTETDAAKMEKPRSSSTQHKGSSTGLRGAGNRRDKRMAMAKRGLRSLAIAVALPLSLTILNIYLFGSSRTRYYVATSTSTSSAFFPPPLWVLHVASLGCAFLMGLSAWLVWAEGGFHRNPMALSLYLGQLVLGLAWDASAFLLGAPWLGLVVCLGMLGATVGCYRQFKGVNPIAGDLVKPCVAWAAILALVNMKLLFL